MIPSYDDIEARRERYAERSLAYRAQLDKFFAELSVHKPSEAESASIEALPLSDPEFQKLFLAHLRSMKYAAELWRGTERAINALMRR